MAKTIPVQVPYTIRVVDDQILFSIKVNNPTDRKLGEGMYGIVGGHQGIANRLSRQQRLRSNLAHELSHVLPGHPFSYPIDGAEVDYDYLYNFTVIGKLI